jgi:hypothetical protein
MSQSNGPEPHNPQNGIVAREVANTSPAQSRKEITMSQLQNNEKTGLTISVLMTLGGLALMIMPFMLGLDLMDMGYGISCIGFFVLLTGLIAVLIFWQRVRTMDRALAGEEILARWIYSETQGRQQVEAEFKRATDQNRTIYLVMVFWFVLIGGAFVGVDYFVSGEINELFAGLFFGFMLFLGAVALLTPVFWRRRALKAGREVIVSRNGVVLNGDMHTWNGPFEGLDRVYFQEDSLETALVFSIRHLSRTDLSAYSTQTLIVPVPSGAQDTAHRVVNTLGAGE